MIIITTDKGTTYQARLYTLLSQGMKFKFSATCTGGHLCAAKQVTRKYYGNRAAESVRVISDINQIISLIGDYASRPRSPRSFRVFTFKR